MTPQAQYIPLPSPSSSSSPEKRLEKSRKKLLPTKIRAVALDLDGTLLHSKDRQISSASVEYLRKLDARGIQIMIATGRPGPTVMQHVLRLNLPKPLPVVCENGARGLLCQALPDSKVNVRELFSTPVPLDVTKRVIAFSQKLGLAVQFYHGSHVYANSWRKSHLELTNRYSENAGCEIIHVEDSFQSLLNANELPNKLLLLCPEAEMDVTFCKFSRVFDKTQVTVVGGKSRKWYIEILAPGVCKGHGLERMCFSLKINTDECVAFGDGSNDLEFLQVAGKGIAMKNANNAVQNAADEVTQYTNNEDGVRRELQKMEKKGMLKTSRTSHMWVSPLAWLKKEIANELLEGPAEVLFSSCIGSTTTLQQHGAPRNSTTVRRPRSGSNASNYTAPVRASSDFVR